MDRSWNDLTEPQRQRFFALHSEHLNLTLDPAQCEISYLQLKFYRDLQLVRVILYPQEIRPNTTGGKSQNDPIEIRDRSRAYFLINLLKYKNSNNFIIMLPTHPNIIERLLNPTVGVNISEDTVLDYVSFIYSDVFFGECRLLNSEDLGELSEFERGALYGKLDIENNPEGRRITSVSCHNYFLIGKVFLIVAPLVQQNQIYRIDILVTASGHTDARKEEIPALKDKVLYREKTQRVIYNDEISIFLVLKSKLLSLLNFGSAVRILSWLTSLATLILFIVFLENIYGLRILELTDSESISYAIFVLTALALFWHILRILLFEHAYRLRTKVPRWLVFHWYPKDLNFYNAITLRFGKWFSGTLFTMYQMALISIYWAYIVYFLQREWQIFIFDGMCANYRLQFEFVIVSLFAGLIDPVFKIFDTLAALIVPEFAIGVTMSGRTIGVLIGFTFAISAARIILLFMKDKHQLKSW